MRVKNRRTGRIEYFTLDQWNNLEASGHSGKFVVLDSHEVKETAKPMKIESFLKSEDRATVDFDDMTVLELRDFARTNEIEIESTRKNDIINELKEKYE